MTPIPSDMPDTLPLGFDPAGMVGEIAADGQPTRVTALACDHDGGVAFVSLAGYESSVSAALARLVKGEQLGFLPSRDWSGPTALQALRVSYWFWRAEVHGTREKQGVAFPYCASIGHGLRHPPRLPHLPPEEAKRLAALRAANPFAQIDEVLARIHAGKPDPDPLPMRIVLAGHTHEAPTPAAFFGHLRALRVLCLPTLAWVDALWAAGLRNRLVVPLHTAGIRAWGMHGNPER
ncbi:MAG: hypothetical protein OHK0022_21890 [Roseiflexaceae bacterium]